MWAGSNNPLQSYWGFCYFFSRRGSSNLYSSEGVDQTLQNLEGTQLHHWCTNSDTLVVICNMLLRFEMTADQRKVMSKSRPNFTLFDPLFKNLGRSEGECWVGVSSILYHQTCGIHLMGGCCMVCKYRSLVMFTLCVHQADKWLFHHIMVS